MNSPLSIVHRPNETGPEPNMVQDRHLRPNLLATFSSFPVIR
jgi:hypothetical protein